jgi:DNA-binding MarR family transcriptional regulator
MSSKSGPTLQLSSQQGKSLRLLQRLSDEWRVMESDMPMSYVVAFYAVANLEATQDRLPNVQDVSHAIGISGPGVSRILLNLSDRRSSNRRVGDPVPSGARKSLGLVERMPDPDDLRMVRYRLTTKGRGLLNRLLGHVEE